MARQPSAVLYLCVVLWVHTSVFRFALESHPRTRCFSDRSCLKAMSVFGFYEYELDSRLSLRPEDRPTVSLFLQRSCSPKTLQLTLPHGASWEARRKSTKSPRKRSTRKCRGRLLLAQKHKRRTSPVRLALTRRQQRFQPTPRRDSANNLPRRLFSKVVC